MRLTVLVIAIVFFGSAFGDTQRCSTDMAFLVDHSSSITKTKYTNTIMPFLRNLVDGLIIDDDEDRVAMVPFSDIDLTSVAFHFSNFSTKSEVIAAIEKEQFRAGNTATRKALELARDLVFDPENGARTPSYKINVAPTLLIITDGVATDNDPASVADELRTLGVSIFAVKVGSLLNEDYLAQITGDAQRVFSATNYADLNKELAEAIIASTTACGQRNGFRRAN